MDKVILKLYGQLNDFLKPRYRGKSLTHILLSRRSVKDLIESFGVPHVEIKRIMVNGDPKECSYIVQGSDFIEVFPPRFGNFNHENNRSSRVGPGEIRFICDTHLGKLARRLRLLGFDSVYGQDISDRDLIKVSNDENRLLLTRDRRLLLHKHVSRAIWIRQQMADEQIREVISRLQIKKYCLPFSRCLVCNGELIDLPLDKEDRAMIYGQVPAGVRQWCHRYKVCNSCQKIFWQGSHYKKLMGRVEDLLGLKE